MPTLFPVVELTAALTHEDITCTDYLTAIAFDSQTLGVRVATVTGASCSFLMSHDLLLINLI
ncbi:hypothetical protein AP285_19600 [Limnospira platensis YZ]|nr:hypothetical protein AP285_19600 [Arthrospira platensis YZ]